MVAPSRSVKFLLLALSATLLLLAPAPAITLEDHDLGVSLAMPDGWTLHPFYRSTTQFVLSPPADQPGHHPPRQIHFVIPRAGFSTLEEANNTEIDDITKRAPAWGSSNNRRNFLGTTLVVTQSGIKGLRATFAIQGSSGPVYTINKYYFRHRDGRIFKVCAHIYGNQALADQYEKAILDGLAYTRSD